MTLRFDKEDNCRHARTLDIVDMGTCSYNEVLERQNQLVNERQARQRPDTLVLVEHPRVYTLGRSADRSNIIADVDALSAAGIEVIKTTRGGDVTYHGPGQLVGYPILDLSRTGHGPVWYVGAIEHMLLMVLAQYGIEAKTDAANRGVWIGNDKIAAIGVRVTRGITMHGFALNVCVDLADYENIVPCGIRDKGITSLDRLIPGVAMCDVKDTVLRLFKKEFGYD